MAARSSALLGVPTKVLTTDPEASRTTMVGTACILYSRALAVFLLASIST